MTMRTMRRLFVSLAIATAGCGQAGATASRSAEPSPRLSSAAPSSVDSAAPSVRLPQGSEVITLDPAMFAGVPLNHPFWPMTVGSRWVYRETDADGTKRVEVTVTKTTKVILGITATVVHDSVTEDGELVEDTLDWYAQDSLGNLWYLGEDTKEYEGGKIVSREGSWEGGVDGAQAGIILPADPQVGMVYRQEYYAGKAEDAAEILSLDETAKVPFGTFTDCLMTKDYTPLDPKVVENKLYARGIGPVKVIQVSGGSSREELLTFKAGP
jgi:hypothetical protein